MDSFQVAILRKRISGADSDTLRILSELSVSVPKAVFDITVPFPFLSLGH